jgi:hypothetical protein
MGAEIANAALQGDTRSHFFVEARRGKQGSKMPAGIALMLASVGCMMGAVALFASGSALGLLCLAFSVLMGALAIYTIRSARSTRPVVVRVEIDAEKSQLLVLNKPLRHLDSDHFVASIDEKSLNEFERVYIHALTGHDLTNTRTNFFMVFEFGGGTEVRLPIGWATGHCCFSAGALEDDGAVQVVARGMTAAGHPMGPESFALIKGTVYPWFMWYSSE